MSILLQTRFNRRAVPEGAPATLYLLVQLAAESRPTNRPPLNLAAVIDRSGSMAGEKLAFTKEALRFLVSHLAPQDLLSVVTFDNAVEVPVPSGPVVNKDALKAQVAGIEHGGMTNLSGGMIAGYRQVSKRRARDRVNRVLLMTDGQANVGVTDPDLLVQKVREMREKGIQLSAFGVGLDFAEDLLTAMAEAGGGNFYFIANPDEIPALFARELEGLLQTAAQGLALGFEAAPGVAVAGVIGYQPAGGPFGLTLALPDIYSGEVKAVVLALELEAAFAGTRPLGRLTLTYSDASSGEEVTAVQDLTVQVTGETDLLEAPEDPAVLKQLYLARSAEALDKAIGRADAGDFAAGASVLQEASAPLVAMARETGDTDLHLRAEKLARYADLLQRSQFEAADRKSMRAHSHQTRTGRHQDR
jgi:Ca-activated chloride channel homolog